MKDNSLFITKRLLQWMGALGVSLTLMTFILFAAFHWNYKFTGSTQEWGEFGDFVGGILNPIIGLLGVIGLLWTIYQNQKELSESREQLRHSAEALRQQKDIAEQQEQRLANQEIKEDSFRLITYLVSELDNILNSEMLVALTIDGPRYSLLRDVVHQDEETFKRVADNGPETIEQADILLEKLATLLQDYSSLPGARKMAVDYFKSKFYLLARRLNYCGVLSDTTADYYDALSPNRHID